MEKRIGWCGAGGLFEDAGAPTTVELRDHWLLVVNIISGRYALALTDATIETLGGSLMTNSLHEPAFHQNTLGVGVEEARLLAKCWENLTLFGDEDDRLPFDLNKWAEALDLDPAAVKLAVSNLTKRSLVELKSDENRTFIRLTQKCIDEIHALTHSEPSLGKTIKPKRAGFKKCLQVAGYASAARVLFKLQNFYLTDKILYQRNGVRCVGYSHSELTTMLANDDGLPIKERTIKLALQNLYEKGFIARKPHKKGGAVITHVRLTQKCIDALGVDITQCPDAGDKVAGWKYYEGMPKAEHDIKSTSAPQPAIEPDNDNSIYPPPKAAA